MWIPQLHSQLTWFTSPAPFTLNGTWVDDSQGSIFWALCECLTDILSPTCLKPALSASPPFSLHPQRASFSPEPSASQQIAPQAVLKHLGVTRSSSDPSFLLPCTESIIMPHQLCLQKHPGSIPFLGLCPSPLHLCSGHLQWFPRSPSSVIYASPGEQEKELQMEPWKPTCKDAAKPVKQVAGLTEGDTAHGRAGEGHKGGESGLKTSFLRQNNRAWPSFSAKHLCEDVLAKQKRWHDNMGLGCYPEATLTPDEGQERQEPGVILIGSVVTNQEIKGADHGALGAQRAAPQKLLPHHLSPASPPPYPQFLYRPGLGPQCLGHHRASSHPGHCGWINLLNNG